MSNTVNETLTPEAFGKVAVLMGGWSAEREVSLKSGKAVYEGLKASGIDAHAIDADRNTIIQQLEQGNFDRAFIVMHGRGGEDGVIQASLELLGIPYTGSRVLASALAMDKLRTKQLLEGCGLPTPPYVTLQADSDYEYVVATLGLPIMVKPSLEGSSIGMSKVKETEQLAGAYDIAAPYVGEVIAESWIDGKEYTVAILGDTALPAIRLVTKRDFYDYQAKYIDDDTQYLCPCGLNEKEESQIQRLALSAFRAVGAQGWGRVDIMVGKDGHAWIIEINTVPGMTDHSLVPMAAKAAGISFNQLVMMILAETLQHNVGSEK